MSGRCMSVSVSVCACAWICYGHKKKGDLFLNTLFQFQKELQNKLPARRGWGAANYKVELPGNWKDTSHEGRRYGEGERRELYLLMIGTRLTLEDSVPAAKRSTRRPTYAVMEKYRINSVKIMSKGGSILSATLPLTGRNMMSKSLGETGSQEWSL